MNIGPKLTPKIIADIAEAYKIGKTTTELALEFKLSKATVCRALRKVGIEPERQDDLFTEKELTEEQINSIASDFINGDRIAELCRKYDCSYKVITRVLEDKNLRESKEPKIVINKETKTVGSGEKERKILGEQEQKELCVKYVEGPYTKQDLSNEYDVHIDTVNAILRRNGFTVKRYLSDEIKIQMIEDFKNGYEIKDIASLYQINPDTVRYWLIKEKLIDGSYSETNEPSKVDTKTVRDLAKKKSPRAIELLESIMEDASAPHRDRALAAKLLLEFGHGKPREQKEDDDEGNSSPAAKILTLIGKK